jgi:hypothetical protein
MAHFRCVWWSVSNVALWQLSNSCLLTSAGWHICNSFSIRTPRGQVNYPLVQHTCAGLDDIKLRGLCSCATTVVSRIWVRNIADDWKSHLILICLSWGKDSFICHKCTTWEPWLYCHSERTCTTDFISLKRLSILARLEPANLESNGKHIPTLPPSLSNIFMETWMEIGKKITVTCSLYIVYSRI